MDLNVIISQLSLAIRSATQPDNLAYREGEMVHIGTDPMQARKNSFGFIATVLKVRKKTSGYRPFQY